MVPLIAKITKTQHEFFCPGENHDILRPGMQDQVIPVLPVPFQLAPSFTVDHDGPHRHPPVLLASETQLLIIIFSSLSKSCFFYIFFLLINSLAFFNNSFEFLKLIFFSASSKGSQAKLTCSSEILISF